MRTIAQLATCLTIILLGACAHPDAAGPDDSAAWTTGQSRAAAQLVENTSRWRQDAYEFVDLKLSGDRLDVTVRYGGGCAAHEFALLVNPAFMESYPVQMRGVLAHDAKGDPCRALVQKTLEFDLSPLKVAYRVAYQASSGRVNLGVDRWGKTVEYAF